MTVESRAYRYSVERHVNEEWKDVVQRYASKYGRFQDAIQKFNQLNDAGVEAGEAAFTALRVTNCCDVTRE